MTPESVAGPELPRLPTADFAVPRPVAHPDGSPLLGELPPDGRILFDGLGGAAVDVCTVDGACLPATTDEAEQ